MKIKNNSARLIGFSWDKVKYDLLPAGPDVEVPDAAMKSAFLKSLLNEKSVSIVNDDESDAGDGSGDDSGDDAGGGQKGTKKK